MSGLELTEATFGKVPKTRPSSFVKGMEEYRDGGTYVQIPAGAIPEPFVVHRKLSEQEVAAVLESIGGSIANVPPPRDSVSRTPVRFPFELARSGKKGRAVCLFEVTTDGTVGRVYCVGRGNKKFFEECFRAVKKWRFPEQQKTSFRVMEFYGSASIE